MRDIKTIFFILIILGFSLTALADKEIINNESAENPAETTALKTQQEWKSRGIGGGGALYSTSISPHDPNLIYIATDMTSVFRSDDFGRSWATVHFDTLQGGIDSHIRFSADPKILYAIDLTDEEKTPVKSTDGGKSWKHLKGDPTGKEAWSLYVDGDSVDRVLISSYDTLYFSDDGGDHFKEVYSADDFLIAGVFWDDRNIYAGTSEGLLISTNGGNSFSKSGIGGIPAGEAMVSFAGARSGGEIRFFAVTLGKGDVYPGVTGGEMESFAGVYSLDNHAGGWRRTATGIPGRVHPFFVAMASDDTAVAYLAGGDVERYAPTVFKTSDGGATWTDVFKTNNNQNIATGWCGDGGDEQWWYPEYALGFAVCPTDADRLILSDLGTAHVSSDGGFSWHQAYVNPPSENKAANRTPNGKSYRSAGLENTSSWWLHWSGKSTLITGMSDLNGMISTDGGLSWKAGSSIGLPYNSTYHIVEHSGTGTLYAATSSVHDIYESTHLADSRLDSGEGSIVYSTNGGKTWRTLHEFDRPVIWLALDPTNSKRMYASVIHSSTGGIYVSDDLNAGASADWRRLAKPPGTEGHPYNIHVLKDGTLVATYSGRRNSGGVFTQSSGLFISTDGGESWQDRSTANMRRWTKDVVIDQNDKTQGTWYLTVFSHWGTSNNEVGGIYRTTDRGKNWQRISNLYRVESVRIDPKNPNIMYASTESRGLWRTDNLGAKKPLFRSVDGYPFKHPMRIFFNPSKPAEIWVTSFGGGVRVLSQTEESLTSPGNLKATALKKNRVKLTWKDRSDNEDGFEIWRREGKKGEWQIVTTTQANRKSYVDKRLSFDTRYYYRIRAVNSSGTSNYSNIARVILRK